MDVVDQRDHEAVIRAADTAERRHVKEIRGMALQMQWMQARWEREAKLRNDAAFAKKFVALQLEVAEACNKADLRILRSIHKQLGIKSPDALLASSRKRLNQQSSSSSSPPPSAVEAARRQSTGPKARLRVFASVLRAVARMRISAREWAQQERTRRRLVDAWEESRRNGAAVVDLGPE
ncbi:Pericentrin-AKAP-450 domain of centrosomal targeting protein-domain-containing protein [Durotheca rogersii]|uniref:Pericentrin-AKAP-450 domain of centrosomal targeting protein-domain-containing protein n=1 Tax=Durotheca rogersii TaxID=419775 RepID=UPI0022202954|nr:Pericentrin-AKAP-450 domain of centrosomal targeting protein-domain-containing protein [Durotheca rogersii]KAI5859907.1 Pericentrin-AKAP-450 domain of centrosomal targeting protein-domain-containing protein [Durotheca rogersii]